MGHIQGQYTIIKRNFADIKNKQVWNQTISYDLIILTIQVQIYSYNYILWSVVSLQEYHLESFLPCFLFVSLTWELPTEFLPVEDSLCKASAFESL